MLLVHVQPPPMASKAQQLPPQGPPQRFDRRWEGAPAGVSGPPQAMPEDMRAVQRGDGPPGSYAAVQHRGGMMMGPPQGGWEREDPSAMQVRSFSMSLLWLAVLLFGQFIGLRTLQAGASCSLSCLCWPKVVTNAQS